MASVGARHLLPVILLSLSACSPHPPTDAEAEKAAYSCHMEFDYSYGGSAFDKASIIVVLKKVSQEEFEKKIPCLKRAFFILRIEGSVLNGKDGSEIEI